MVNSDRAHNLISQINCAACDKNRSLIIHLAGTLQRECPLEGNNEWDRLIGKILFKASTSDFWAVSLRADDLRDVYCAEGI